MNTNYNREAFVRSLEKLCLLHRGIFAFSEDVTYDVKKAVPEGFDPLMYFTFKPVYTFEAYGNSNEHLNGRYDTNPIFDKNAYMLDVNLTGVKSNLKEDLSNIKLLEVDGDNVKSIDFVKQQEQKQKENSEVSDNEKSEHTENNDENQKNTEHIEES